MFLHPYQGGTYFRAGRSNGLDFWESVPLTFLGSAEWEFFGETTKPSLNDFYNTGSAASSWARRSTVIAVVRDNQATGMNRFLRELAAFPFDPAGSVKRLFTGELWRVHANPGSMSRPARAPAAGRSQAGHGHGGHRQALDRGAPWFAELAYGDPFDAPYTRPFDGLRAARAPQPRKRPDPRRRSPRGRSALGARAHAYGGPVQGHLHR